MNGFTQWKDKAFWALLLGSLSIVVSGAISFSAWVTIRLMSTPDREEVSEMIETNAPYIEDRRMIHAQLAQSEKTEARLADVIDRNTEAIHALRTQIAKIRVDE